MSISQEIENLKIRKIKRPIIVINQLLRISKESNKRYHLEDYRVPKGRAAMAITYFKILVVFMEYILIFLILQISLLIKIFILR